MNELLFCGYFHETERMFVCVCVCACVHKSNKDHITVSYISSLDEESSVSFCTSSLESSNKELATVLKTFVSSLSKLETYISIIASQSKLFKRQLLLYVNMNAELTIKELFPFFIQLFFCPLTHSHRNATPHPHTCTIFTVFRKELLEHTIPGTCWVKGTTG